MQHSNKHAMPGKLVIRGVTTFGQTFRPSDWADRLAGAVSVFGQDNHTQYSSHVQPVYCAGQRCVVVNKELEHQAPRAYAFLMDFARGNQLDVVDGH